MDSVLECKDLTKLYSGKVALDNVNVSLPRGKIIGLLGTNGSGKTTLIKLAAGLLTPTAGKILIDGDTPCAKTKAKTAYLPDRDFMPEWSKVNDTLDIYDDFFEDFDRQKAVEILKTLSVNASDRFRSLSKGTREKVQLAVTMSRRAELYLLDEPIGGVDPATRDYILRTIISNYSENSTVVISTHLIADIESILDDVLFMQNGRIVLSSSVDEIREEKGKSVDALFREVFKW